MGISTTNLLIILAIVVLLFGAKRLKNLGSDLGGAIKGFRKAMDDDEGKPGVKHETAAHTYESDIHKSEENEKTKS